MAKSINLPAIVLAAFGASSPIAREVYANVEARVRTAFPEHKICWAYLSQQIVAKQRKLGVFLPTLSEALVSLKQDGFEKAAIQPLLVVPGEEFAAVKSVSCDGLKLSIGDPLLSSETDMEAALAAITPHIQKDIPNVLICHGNQKHTEYNEPLLRLKSLVESRYYNVVVASIEGDPGRSPLLRANEMAKIHGEVVFIPIMMAAGEHVTRDVMGDDPGSWKHIVGARHSACLEPLGKNASILEIYLSHIGDAMQRLTIGALS
jgi:sirohydrochlorin cobaltochelatase